MTLRAYAGAAAAWFPDLSGRLRYLPWEPFRASVAEKNAEQTLSHIQRSPNCSIAKAQRLLDYRPRFRSLQAVYEAVQWMIANAALQV